MDMDALESSDSTIPVEEQTVKNDEISTKVILMGPPPLPVAVKRQQHQRNDNKRHGNTTTNSSTMDVSGTSDSLNSQAVPAERSVMQDKDSERPGTSATMYLPLDTAATARKPITNGESDETDDSQQETDSGSLESNPQGSMPKNAFLQQLVDMYEKELAEMKEELKRVKNSEVKPED